MEKLKTETNKTEHIKRFAKANDATAVRKEIGRVWGLKKTARNERYIKLFGEAKTFGDLIKKSKKCAKSIEILSKKPACFKHSKNEGIAESIDLNVRTLEDLIRVCQVDLNEWKVAKYVINKWASASKTDDDHIHVEPLYQVKAWLERKKEAKDRKAIVAEFRKALDEVSPKNFIKSPEKKKGLLYEIAMPDLHIGKLAWGEETGTGENYDTEIASDLVRKAVSTLTAYVDMNNVEKILLPIGNDFFNVDNAQSTTTAGTPQSEDSRWQNTFMKGAKILVEIVEYLALNTPVDIVVVQGNHDHERSFYLGEYLSAWFRNHPSVTVNNAPTTRKYYRWKNVLIGMTHGNEEKHAELPLIMATERPADWAECTTKTFQIGHFHREKVEDIKGVKIHTLASLCAGDAWHSKKGYIGSERAAEGLLFDGKQGLVANYYFYANK